VKRWAASGSRSVSACGRRRTLALTLAALFVIAGCRSDPIAGEADRLAALLAPVPGATIAEIGAGSGSLTIALARRVDPRVHVLSTELGEERVRKLSVAARQAGAANVSVLEGAEQDTALRADSCDAIILRQTYHHFMHPKEMTASLFRSLRPGGLLAVIEHEPYSMGRPLTDVLPSRGGDGIRPAMLMEELSAAGFRHVRTMNRWSRGLYLVLMQKPPR
jgi:predicted methyltransferase